MSHICFANSEIRIIYQKKKSSRFSGFMASAAHHCSESACENITERTCRGLSAASAGSIAHAQTTVHTAMPSKALLQYSVPHTSAEHCALTVAIVPDSVPRLLRVKNRGTSRLHAEECELASFAGRYWLCCCQWCMICSSELHEEGTSRGRRNGVRQRWGGTGV